MYDYSVYEVLKEAALGWPDKPAICDSEGVLSFFELYRSAEQLKEALNDLGIGAGMAVGMKASNSRSFIAGLFGVIGCGAAVIPIYHQLKKTEIDALLNETAPQAILDDQTGTACFDGSDAIIPLPTGSFHLNFLKTNAQSIFAPHVERPAFVRFTSGTTGKSKGVVISHKSALERIEAANKGLGLGPGDVVIWVLPMAYHFLVSIVLYIKYGVAIVIAKDFLAKNIIALTNQYGGTLLYASPFQIRLLANDAGTEKMPTLKTAISTSAGISLDVCIAFTKRFDINVNQAYGIIEIGLPIINPMRSSEQADAVGYALPDFEVAILDKNDNPLPRGIVGRLGIRGPGMFDAYLFPAKKRDEILVNGYFMTADYASMTAGGLINIEGREKSVINVSGIKVFPEEIEAVLETIPKIKIARISSSPHHLLGQIIEAEIVIEEGCEINIEDALAYCRQRLSNFKAPQRIKVVTELPMTSTGKLRRD